MNQTLILKPLFRLHLAVLRPRSLQSFDSFEVRALDALQALDEAVTANDFDEEAGAESDVESDGSAARPPPAPPGQYGDKRLQTMRKFHWRAHSGYYLKQTCVSSPKAEISGCPQRNVLCTRVAIGLLWENTVRCFVCPAAPPLPAPRGSGAAMQVKRMNWEKIDAVQENTIWAQVS